MQTKVKETRSTTEVYKKHVIGGAVRWCSSAGAGGNQPRIFNPAHIAPRSGLDLNKTPSTLNEQSCTASGPQARGLDKWSDAVLFCAFYAAQHKRTWGCGVVCGFCGTKPTRLTIIKKISSVLNATKWTASGLSKRTYVLVPQFLLQKVDHIFHFYFF